MLYIHFSYNDQRVYHLGDDDEVYAAANLPGWEDQLGRAEAAQNRRSKFVQKDQRLSRDFRKGFFFFFFLFSKFLKGMRPNKKRKSNNDSWLVEDSDDEQVQPMTEEQAHQFWSEGRYY